ncbi:hypothetical protein [Bacillus sp. AK031]
MSQKLLIFVFTLILLGLAGCNAAEKDEDIADADLQVKHWDDLSESRQIELVKIVLDENQIHLHPDQEERGIKAKNKFMDLIFEKKEFQELPLKNAILKHWRGEDLVYREKELLVDLSLEGASENWNVDRFQLEGGPDHFKAGGSLHLKSSEEYQSQFMHFDAHMVISNEVRDLFGSSVLADSGETTDISGKHNAGVEGGSFIHQNGSPVKMGDIDEIYLNVEWYDTEKSTKVKERISLYRRP